MTASNTAPAISGASRKPKTLLPRSGGPSTRKGDKAAPAHDGCRGRPPRPSDDHRKLVPEAKAEHEDGQVNDDLKYYRADEHDHGEAKEKDKDLNSPENGRYRPDVSEVFDESSILELPSDGNGMPPSAGRDCIKTEKVFGDKTINHLALDDIVPLDDEQGDAWWCDIGMGADRNDDTSDDGGGESTTPRSPPRPPPGQLSSRDRSCSEISNYRSVISNKNLDPIPEESIIEELPSPGLDTGQCSSSLPSPPPPRIEPDYYAWQGLGSHVSIQRRHKRSFSMSMLEESSASQTTSASAFKQSKREPCQERQPKEAYSLPISRAPGLLKTTNKRVNLELVMESLSRLEPEAMLNDVVIQTIAQRLTSPELGVVDSLAVSSKQRTPRARDRLMSTMSKRQVIIFLHHDTHWVVFHWRRSESVLEEYNSLASPGTCAGGDVIPNFLRWVYGEPSLNFVYRKAKVRVLLAVPISNAKGGEGISAQCNRMCMTAVSLPFDLPMPLPQAKCYPSTSMATSSGSALVAHF